MKNKYEIIKEYKPNLPSKFWYSIYRLVLFFINLPKKIKYTYNFDKKEMKNRQVLLLSDHASTDSYMYMSQGYKFCNPNIVMGYQNIFIKGLFGLLLKIGVIPKKLYVNDLRAIMNIFSLVNKGGSIAILPEGIQSSAGYTMPIYPATANLIKKCNLDCILCKTNGSYLNRPRFDKNYRIGNIEVSFEILFRKEELSNLSVEEIHNRLFEKIKYNEFIWNKEKRYKYKGKYPNSHSMERILYHCPKCNRDFKLSSIGDKLRCECGLEVYVNDYYDISSNYENFPYSRIDEWFTDERMKVRLEIQNPDFRFEYDCKYYTIDYTHLTNDSIKEVNKGHMVITKNSMCYTTVENGENIEYIFDLSKIKSAPFVSGMANEIYYDDSYYRFIPLCKESISLKIMFIIEELHILHDEAWQKALNDTLKE